MNIFDIIVLLLLGLGAIKGYQQGFIVEIFSLLAFFLGLFLALKLTIPISRSLFSSGSFFEMGAIITFILLFLLLTITIKVGAKAIKSFVHITFLGILDNLFGALVGSFKFAFIVSIVFWVLDSVGLDIVTEYMDDAIIFPYIVGVGPKIFEWLSTLLPFIRELIDSMESLPNDKNTMLTRLIQ